MCRSGSSSTVLLSNKQFCVVVQTFQSTKTELLAAHDTMSRYVDLVNKLAALIEIT